MNTYDAQLELLSTVQQALVSNKAWETLYPLVGDELRKIFNIQAVMICTFDHESGMEHFSYHVEKGVRQDSRPHPMDAVSRHLILMRQWLLIDSAFVPTLNKLLNINIESIRRSDLPQSALWVPLMVGELVTGYIGLQNSEREYAFSQHDVRFHWKVRNVSPKRSSANRLKKRSESQKQSNVSSVSWRKPCAIRRLP
jgi:transcriptional regulator with GAF, ATPase, and Fis domain